MNELEPIEQELIVNEPAKEVEIVVLKPLEEAFAQEYAKTGNACKSYAKAHDLDIENPLVYARARTLGSRALARVDITKRINQLLSLTDFNDESMDVQLNMLAHQHTDFKTKLGAIKEYNALKGRTGSKSNIFSGNTFNLAQMLDRANAKDA